MSDSDAAKQNVRLVASAEEGTEIFVIDGRFRRVASALNRIETDLPPGLYTVKFKRGGALAEVDTDLLPGAGPVEVRAPAAELAFDLAAPMEQTFTSHEYHQEAAARISRTDPVKIGEGPTGCLFLFVRDIGADGIVGPRTRQRLRLLIEEVVGNLARMLGEHPDVRALRNELAGDGSGSTATQGDAPPPMLRRSWEILVRSDPFYREAKAGSILERIADRIWGSGPWLVWEVPPAASRTRDVDPGRFGKLLSIIGNSAAGAGELAQALGKVGLNLMEESVVMHSLKQVGTSPLGKSTEFIPTTGADAAAPAETSLDTAKFIGLPVTTLKRNLASAMAKIDAAIESKSDSLRKLTEKIEKK